MFEIFKKKVKFLIHPKDIYEANYFLFALLRNFYVYPLKLTFESNYEKYKLLFDRKQLYIPFFAMLFITFEIFVQLKASDISLSTLLHFISIDIFYPLGFFVVAKLEKVLNKILLLDKYFNNSERILLYKSTKYRHFFILIFVLLIIFYHMKPYTALESSLSILGVLFFVHTIVPFINIFLIIYCHLNLVRALNLRLSLATTKLELIFQNILNNNNMQKSNKSEIVQNLEIISNICDIVEDINCDFGAIIIIAICGFLTWLAQPIFFSVKNSNNLIVLLFYYKNFPLWLLGNIVLILIVVLYYCHNPFSKVSICAKIIIH